jgi:hypothetical protein
MRTTHARLGAIAALLIASGAALAGCGGSTTTTPVAAPTTAAAAFGTATCSTSGATSAAIPSATLVGATSVTTPTLGGCSLSSNVSTVFPTITTGTFSGSIQLTAPAGLAAIPASNTCTTSCANNAPPTGFAAANFVPVIYTVLQVSGFTGTTSPNNAAQTIMVNSLTSGTNNANFFIGTWNATAAGATPPAIASTTFSGWSNNNNQTAFANLPLTASPPNTLTLPAESCSPAGSDCASSTITAPGASFTIVQVFGYFT